jgi:hypothetical protein
MMEHSLVLIVFRHLYVYDDALGIGAIGFLTLSGMGSLIASRRLRPIALAAATVAMALFLAGAVRRPAAGVLAAAPIALATGMFFPALFDRAARNPVAVFALDAVGSGWGALLSTFIPIIWGLDAFLSVSGAVFLGTVLADAWFHGHLGRSPIEPCAATASSQEAPTRSVPLTDHLRKWLVASGPRVVAGGQWPVASKGRSSPATSH